MEDQERRQALIEGFINMADTETLREETDTRIFHARADRGGAAAAAARGADDTATALDTKEFHMAKDYIEMDDDDPFSEMGAAAALHGGKVAAGELRENTNIIKSSMHVFKANVGTGIFMLPTFYPDSGYILSPVLFLLIGIIVVDCTHMLLRTKLIINRRNVTTYSQVCRFVCGPAMQWFLFTALVLTQYGFCLMYSQLASYTMMQLVDFSGSTKVWAVVVFAICFPITCYSSNLSLLGIFSTISTVMVFYTLVCAIVETLLVIGRAHGKMHPTCTAFGRDLPIGWFNNLANDMMVLEGIAIVLPVHAACTQKHLVSRMLTIVLSIVIAIYLLIGITGYLAYGTSIVTSLVAAMEFSAWGTSIRIAFVISVVLAYPLQFQSAIQLSDQMLRCTPRSWKGLASRLAINVVILALSIGVGAEAVNTVVAFIGALPSCCMVLIIPTILYMHVSYAVDHPDESRTSKHYWMMLLKGSQSNLLVRVRGVAYSIIGVLIMIIGTYSIIKGLVNKP